MVWQSVAIMVLGACTGDSPETTETAAPEPTGTTPPMTADTSPTGDTGPKSTTDTGPTLPRVLPRDSLVVPDKVGVTFLGLDGSLLESFTWSDLVGPCATCGGEGGSPDGDGLLLSFTTGDGPGNVGAVARVNGKGQLDFRVNGFAFPHDVIRDPADNHLAVVATFTNDVRWIAGDGSSGTVLRSIGSSDPEFPNTPNGAELLEYNGRNFILLSHRPNANGRITLWDITDPKDPVFVWRFPETGRIAVPHGPILRQRGADWWLLWAHTNGGPSGRGSVGLAVTTDPTLRPTYVADLDPEPDIAPFTFLRGVELLDDGRMYVTDSGSAGGNGDGRIFLATFPTLAPSGNGEVGSIGDQRFETLGPAPLIYDDVTSPFEAWYWPPVN
ncbi:MAG: hypothetical protein AAGA48_03985 [Myxococcota bacterium]